MNETQIKHIELIQGVISRMASNSFMLKGWSITIISGLFFLSTISRENNISYALPILPTFVFWGLDSYYLRQERLFRKLYDHARKAYLNETLEFDCLSMDTRPYSNEVGSWLAVIKSPTEISFYGVLIMVVVLLNIFCLFGSK